ncbi:hypothetical protein [Nocardioides speluncae]|uniref:hypothetical protein n=1 Tax=Nocardioides speluncae TaxID=2670337 RepID=UPI0012B183D2|nr:hypothetical protein [Nocardioides speluncae]
MRGRPDALSDGGRTRTPGGSRRTRVLTAAVVGLALVALVVWYAARDRPEHNEQAQPPSSSAPNSSGEPSPGPTDPSTSAHPTTPPATKTQQIVTGFVRGWLLRGSASDRAEALRPYAVTELVSGLARTDVRNLPEEGTKAVGDPELELGATAVRGDYVVKLSNGESLLVTVALVGDDRWRVVKVAPGDDEPSSIDG